MNSSVTALGPRLRLLNNLRIWVHWSSRDTFELFIVPFKFSFWFSGRSWELLLKRKQGNLATFNLKISLITWWVCTGRHLMGKGRAGWSSLSALRLSEAHRSLDMLTETGFGLTALIKGGAFWYTLCSCVIAWCKLIWSIVPGYGLIRSQI